MTAVLVAGHVNCDVTLLVDSLPDADEEAAVRERHRGGGGSAANVAAGLAGLDLSAKLLGSVGEDETGRTVLAALAERGVDVEEVRLAAGETSTKYLLVAGEDVAVLGKDGVNEAVGPGDVDESAVADVEHLHLTGQRADTAERLAELAVDAGCTVSLDPGRRAEERDLDGVVERADVVFGTARETAALFEERVPAAAGSETLVVETSGPGGATCYGDGEISRPGFEVDVADTSGAGDAFVAGFLSVWLDDRENLEQALLVGNACGAIVSQTIGARSKLDTRTVEHFSNI